MHQWDNSSHMFENFPASLLARIPYSMSKLLANVPNRNAALMFRTRDLICFWDGFHYVLSASFPILPPYHLLQLFHFEFSSFSRRSFSIFPPNLQYPAPIPGLLQCTSDSNSNFLSQPVLHHPPTGYLKNPIFTQSPHLDVLAALQGVSAFSAPIQPLQELWQYFSQLV